MKSPVIKRSIVIAGHKTSVSLEDAFWTSLKEIARERGQTLSELTASIDTERHHGNLSSAIRLFVLSYYRSRCDGIAAETASAPQNEHSLAASGAHPRDLMLSASAGNLR